MPAEQEDKIVQQLLAAAIPMTPLQRLVGGIGNKDRGPGRLRPRRRAPIRLLLGSQVFLDEVGHSRGPQFFRKWIDQVLEQIGPDASAKISRLHAQLGKCDDGILEKVLRCSGAFSD